MTKNTHCTATYGGYVVGNVVDTMYVVSMCMVSNVVSMYVVGIWLVVYVVSVRSACFWYVVDTWSVT